MQPVRLGPDSYGCQVCKKMCDYPAMVAHLQTHDKAAISHNGYKIYRCQHNCANTRSPHYHCVCATITGKKASCIKHLQTCPCMRTPPPSQGLSTPSPMPATHPPPPSQGLSTPSPMPTTHPPPPSQGLSTPSPMPTFFFDFLSVFLSLSFYCRCGKRFCHFTQEGHQMVNGLLAPVFRVTRKRKRKVLTKADDVFLKDTIEAAAWCQLQTFTDHVSLPMVIGVEGAEQQALLAELKSVDRSCPEESPNRIEPFQFFFNSKKDYEMFCVEMFDRRKLKVFASWE
ncbi:unnamed protein product [Gadus morhua 'NCC']